MLDYDVLEGMDVILAREVALIGGARYPAGEQFVIKSHMGGDLFILSRTDSYGYVREICGASINDHFWMPSAAAVADHLRKRDAADGVH